MKADDPDKHLHCQVENKLSCHVLELEQTIDQQPCEPV